MSSTTTSSPTALGATRQTDVFSAGSHPDRALWRLSCRTRQRSMEQGHRFWYGARGTWRLTTEPIDHHQYKATASPPIDKRRSVSGREQHLTRQLPAQITTSTSNHFSPFVQRKPTSIFPLQACVSVGSGGISVSVGFRIEVYPHPLSIGGIFVCLNGLVCHKCMFSPFFDSFPFGLVSFHFLIRLLSYIPIIPICVLNITFFLCRATRQALGTSGLPSHVESIGNATSEPTVGRAP